MELYRKILQRFPRGSLSYVFAYGSGVKQQIGYDNVNKQTKNVIDLMFCVRDPLGWHSENLLRQPDDYSALRHLGINFIRNYQEKFGASVYCNTLVPLEELGVTVKYGVISRDDLLTDLTQWTHLYLAGRLHKPVFDIVKPFDDKDLTQALKDNRVNAFRAALLILPAKFTSFQLFHTICNLSYKGDFRMIFGENKNKVQNIVKAQEADFMELYGEAMGELAAFVAVDHKAKALGSDKTIVLFEQDKSFLAKDNHLRHLPAELCKRLVRNTAFDGKYMDIVEHLAKLDNLDKIVQVSVNDIVWKSSITQSLKNIPSAGIVKSVIYSYRKAKKTFAY